MCMFSYALVVHDPGNTAVNQLRNAILQANFMKEFKTAVEQLLQMKELFDEVRRVNEGVDEIKSMALDAARLPKDAVRELMSVYGAHHMRENLLDIPGMAESFKGEFSDIRSFLDYVHGKDPRSKERIYITQDEAEIAGGLEFSEKVKDAARVNAGIGEMVSSQAGSASPKGAARLTADALGKLITLTSETQAIQAEMLRMQAVGLEQVSRDEKRFERERIKFMKDFQESIKSLPGRRK